MSLPKQKISKARKRKRRSHLALSAPSKSLCPNCKQPCQPHRICGSCGYYRNEAIVELEEDEE